MGFGEAEDESFAAAIFFHTICPQEENELGLLGYDEAWKDAEDESSDI